MYDANAVEKEIDLLVTECEKLNEKLRDKYGFDGDFEEFIDDEGGEIDWEDLRDFDNLHKLLECQQKFFEIIKTFDSGDAKSIHNANKDIEMLIREIRQRKNALAESIELEQRALSDFEGLLKRCNDIRNKA